MAIIIYNYFAMESFLNETGNKVENQEDGLEKWHSLKEQASDMVNKIMEERFADFESLDSHGRVLILEQLIAEYGSKENFNNDNRFLAEEIAQRLTLEKARLEMEVIIEKYPELAKTS